MILNQLGTIPYEECVGRYRKVRQLVGQATADAKQQSAILQVLFRYGGRCDCTVDRNVVRVPENLVAAEKQIQAILGC